MELLSFFSFFHDSKFEKYHKGFNEIEQETAGLKVRAYDQGESRKENGNSGFDTSKEH